MDHPETLAILCTKDTGRRQTKQINVIEKTKGAIKNGQSRDTGNIVNTRYKAKKKKTNNTTKHRKLKINHILVQFLHRDFFFSCLLNLG
jgi:hypothetical protein